MSITAACPSITSISTGSASTGEQEGLNLREYLYVDGVSLIEWFEYLPADEVDEYLEINYGASRRRQAGVTFSAHGTRYESLLKVYAWRQLSNFG